MHEAEVTMKEEEDDTGVVLSYLRRIAAASSALARDDTSRDIAAHNDQVFMASTSEDCQSYMDQIARDLLHACQLDLISLPPNHHYLPKQDTPHENLKRDLPLDPSRIRQWQRTDYLRNLLRAMAPIAMDIAAQIAGLMIVTNDTHQQVKDNATACFLLFSTWLPIAPHLALLVSELSSLPIFPCPLIVEESTDTRGQNLTKQQYLMAEAVHAACQFYHDRGEINMLLQWCNWGAAFSLMNQACTTSINQNEAIMDMEEDSDEESSKDQPMTDSDTNGYDDLNPNNFSYTDAIRWHVARIIGYILQMTPLAKGQYFDKLNVGEVRVPWVIHPWIIDQEEADTQEFQIMGKARLWTNDYNTFEAPSAAQIRKLIALHPWLVHVGHGIVFCKHNAISCSMERQQYTDNKDAVVMEPSPSYMRAATGGSLTRTVTTTENLALVGAAMSTHPPPPVLLCGPQGSGKSSLVRELAAMFSSSSHHHNKHDLLEIHVDEETDAKTLVGTYTMTDIPGEFAWKAGALTMAVRMGKWVLIEDLDSVPIEIQASLVKLLEDRVLPLGLSGKMERCHPNFRLFATLSADDSHNRRLGKKILNPSLWRKVFVKPLPYEELRQIALSLYPNLPSSISECALNILKAVDRSGRDASGGTMHDDDNNHPTSLQMMRTGGRRPSVRDFFKLLSRIANGVVFERDAQYATESQRTLCMAESVDVFCAASPSREHRRDFVRGSVAPTWGLTADLALAYMESRRPVTLVGSDYVEVGRAKLPVVATRSAGAFDTSSARDFTETSFSLRLMESIAVGVKENEPLLLGKAFKSLHTRGRFWYLKAWA
jgi:ABC-type multidrug transport system fused ATPase/permease subunit